MKVYYKCFKKQVPLFLLDLLCLLIDVTLEMSLPFLMARILDKGVKVMDFSVVWQTSLLMIGLAIIAAFFGVIAMRLSSIISTNFCMELRRVLFSRIQEFSFKNIDHFEVPSLVTRLTSDVNIFRMAVLNIARIGLKAPLMVIAGSVFMFIYNVKLAAIVLSVSLILFVLIAVIIYWAVPKFRQTQVKIDNVNRVVEENTEGIRVVKSFVREDYESQKFSSAAAELENIGAKAFKIANINIPLILLALNLCNALILGLGGIDAAKGTGFTTGELSSFINFSTTVLMSFNMISGLIMILSRTSASKERLDKIFNEKIDIRYDKKDKIGDFDPTHVVDGSIEFNDVTFSYVDDKNKLAVGPVSIKINSGEVIGIVGGTGAGKSSLVSLIPRLYDTLDGSVTVAGRDVKDYDLLALRESIGFVTQKNVLFSGTIEDNIRWGKEDASIDEINQALKAAQAFDFVYRFKDGLQTVVAQGGTSVSGGQKQRLSIARAIIKRPKILILDDSTSAVDVMTESKIRQAFYRDLKGTTVLVIAQRISSVQAADKIIVLDRGSVECIGTHEQLLEKSKIYKEIYETQKNEVQ